MTKVILVANTDWYLYNFRRSLARYLIEQGFDVLLVTPMGDYVEKFNELGFRWLQWDVGRQSVAPWRELSALVALKKIYQQEKAELIHHHTIKPVLYGTLAARMAGVGGVVNSITGRGFIFLSTDPKARLLKLITRPLYRLAFRFPDQVVIFENEDDQQYFITNKLISADRTSLIAGVGVDTHLFHPLPPPPEPVTVMLSSRMLWDKGIGILVDAARELRKRCQVRFVLVGQPDPGNPSSISEAQLNEWATEGIVEWWGWREDMNRVYREAHIVALPTMYGEGVPTVLLEAAACGRPLVGSDIPGCRAVIINGYNGFLVPPNDPVALAQSLEILIGDSDLRGRMGEASRNLVMQKFTVTQVNQATFAVYQRLLKPA